MACVALAKLFAEATGIGLCDGEKTACLGSKVCAQVLPRTLFDKTEADCKAAKLADSSQ